MASHMRIVRPTGQMLRSQQALSERSGASAGGWSCGTFLRCDERNLRPPVAVPAPGRDIRPASGGPACPDLDFARLV
jgi:hypothetical protein